LDLNKIKNGDENEIRKMANTVSSWIYHHVLILTKNVQDAEEVVQDTIIKILDVLIDGVNKNGTLVSDTSFRPWVYRIAINKAKDRIKWNNQKKRSPLQKAESDQKIDSHSKIRSTIVQPDQQMILNERHSFLLDCIGCLPENQKEVILLAKVEGHSIKEVAKIMNNTPKAVESLLSRGKKKLKLIISEREKLQ